MLKTRRLKRRVLLRLQQLDMFLVLMETGSIRATSEYAGMTQSAISKSLKEIELMMETDLFQRMPGGLKPLPTARLFLRYAMDTVQGFNLLYENLRQGVDDGDAKVGVAGGLAKVLLNKAIKATPPSTDWASVQLHIEDTPALLDRLDSGQLDMLVTYLPRDMDEDRFEFVSIATDTLIAATHARHEAASNGASLANFPWEVPQPGDPVRQRMQSAMESAGIPWPSSLIEYSLPVISNEVLLGNTILWIARSHACPLLEQGLLTLVLMPFAPPTVQIGCIKPVGKRLPTSAMTLWNYMARE